MRFPQKHLPAEPPRRREPWTGRRSLSFCATAFLRLCGKFLLLLLGGSALAQAPLDDLIFTVGTTIRDRGNQHWYYVLVGAAEPTLLGGKRFAVFAKAGDAASASPFTRRSDLFQQTDG